MTRFWGRNDDGLDRLRRDLRAQKVEPSDTFVRSVTDTLDGRAPAAEARWVRPKGRLVLLAALASGVLAAGASANALTAVTTAATRAIDVVQHLSSQQVAHTSSVVVTHATPADAQYAPETPAPNPKISIKKGPATQSVAHGGTATFTITVTNSGNVALTGVAVHDPKSPDCSRTIGSLNAGETKTYTCTATNLTKSFENVATVSGKTSAGKGVSGSGHAKVSVAPLTPPQVSKITIVKSPKSQTVKTELTTTRTTTGATTTTVKYGTAHFTIKVTNAGNVALHDVTVADPSTPSCDRSIGTLAAGASHTYNCSKSAVTASFTNVATATGVSSKNVKATATAHAKVTVTTKTTNTSSAKFTG